MADLKDVAEASEADAEDLKALREVNETLERADAFVILINSTEIDPLDEKPRRNPFSPSVNFMLSHCRAERKPVALLFSQIDQTPRLTEELFRTLPRVQEFERKFTHDLQESSQGGRPFGIVRRISCYETVPGDLAPRRQTLDGSIWCREPAQVVLDLLRAAMPRINERVAREAEEVEKLKGEEDRDTRRKGKRQWAVRIAASLGSLLILGLLVLAWYKRTESRQIRLLEGVEANLHEGKLASILPASEAEIDKILAENRADPGHTPTAVRAAIGDLESALGEAGQMLVDQPALDVAYGEEIARFQGLVPHFDAAVTDPWREKFLPLLSARGEFLSNWFGIKREERRARTSFIDESAKRFSGAGDPGFSSLLTVQSTKEKEGEVASWQARIDADADVASRLATIQSLLASAVAEQDTEFSRLARRALAGHLVVAILKRQENRFIREKLLTPLTPNLAKLGDGEVRFEVLASELLACANEEECENRQGVVQTAITEAETTASSWGSGVDNLLRSLLLDLPLEERREVWGALAQSVASSYLFSARPDAWPGEIRPLHESILALANAETDSTVDLIERIARHPIYEEELHYLGDRLAATEIRRKAVPIYSTILSALSQQESPLPTDVLALLSQQASSVLADRTSATGPLAEIGHEIEQVLSLAKEINNQRARGGFVDASAAVRLDHLLHDARRGHCVALEPHEAPTECANAA